MEATKGLDFPVTPTTDPSEGLVDLIIQPQVQVEEEEEEGEDSEVQETETTIEETVKEVDNNWTCYFCLDSINESRGYHCHG